MTRSSSILSAATSPASATGAASHSASATSCPGCATCTKACWPRAFGARTAGATGSWAAWPCCEIGRAHVNSSHLVISYAVFCLKKKNHRELVVHRLFDEVDQVGDAVQVFVVEFGDFVLDRDVHLVVRLFFCHPHQPLLVRVEPFS